MARYTVKTFSGVLPPSPFVVCFWSKKDLPLKGRDGARVQALLKSRQATSDAQEQQLLLLPHPRIPRTVLCIGLGKTPALDTIRRGVAKAVLAAKKQYSSRITVVVPAHLFSDAEALGTSVVEGAELGAYTFLKYQEKKQKAERASAVSDVVLLTEKPFSSALKRGVQKGLVFSAATISARNLVNEPASHATPLVLLEEAQRIVKASRGVLKLEMLDEKACRKLGMNAFLAVAQGSVKPPVFLHVSYVPKQTGKRLPIVGLVGKGITFDSGGLSIKPSKGMETMKMDMAGAAAVLAVFSALPKLRLPVAVHGYIAACENMPSGSAMRPGDIVKAANGTTIEIRNTDAEGRLTLADALIEAQKNKPDVLVDLATLTGHCIVALGEDIAGLFTNTPAVGAALQKAADASGEPVWELPMPEQYRAHVKSQVADLRNDVPGKLSGAIHAALFLEEFVHKTPWAHLDIAGPAWTEHTANPVLPLGASGYGVRLLLRFLETIDVSFVKRS